jgi:hypothetical protein
MIAALTVALLLASAAPHQESTSDRVEIVAIEQQSPSNVTYAVRLTDNRGRDVCGADLDLGALTDNPDFRVNTAKLVEQAVDGSCRYVHTVQYPASGDFVLVVRVHEPRQFVHLGRELIKDQALPSSSDHIDTPSRQALRSINPDFAATYDPMTGIGSNQGPQQVGARTSDHGHAEATSPTPAATPSGRVRQTNMLWATLASLLALYAVVRLWSRTQAIRHSRSRGLFTTAAP